LEKKRISWDDFSNYLIQKASNSGSLGEGIKSGKTSINSIAAGGTADELGIQSLGSSEIKHYSLSLTTMI